MYSVKIWFRNTFFKDGKFDWEVMDALVGIAGLIFAVLFLLFYRVK